MNLIDSISSLFSPVYEKQLETELEKVLSAFLESFKTNPFQTAKITDFAEAKPLLSLEKKQKIILVKVVLQKLYPFQHKNTWVNNDIYRQQGLNGLLSQILRANLSYSEDELIELIQTAKKFNRTYSPVPVSTILRQVDYFIADQGLTKDVEIALRELKETIHGNYSEQKKLREKIKKLLGISQVSTIEPGDVWSDALRQMVKQLEPDRKRLWHHLINHAFTANSSSAPQKWLAESKKLIDEIGLDEFKTNVLRWFKLFGIPGERETLKISEYEGARYEYFNKPLSDKNCELMKGLIWTCISFPDAELIKAIAQVCESAFKKLKGYGARSTKVGNAGVYVLGEFSIPEAVSQLENLRRKIKYHTAQSLIEKALEKAALQAGISREELEEISLSDYDLDQNGFLLQNLGNYSAQIRIENGIGAKLSWFNANGQSQKSVPSEVKNDFADELKDLQKTVKEITKALQTQREQFQNLYLQERSWTFEKWKERYLHHPLRQNLTKHLIWEFSAGDQKSSGIWSEGKLVDRQKQEINWISASTEVRLWHPINAEVNEVLDWRLFLEENQIVQPFKQAHREIYVLTDAEKETGTYSNRFAAHVLKQHQFHALCQQKGWIYTLQGDFDSHNRPTLKLPRWNLEIEFWVEPNLERNNLSWSGICLYVSSDQVRFYQTDGTKQKKWVYPDPRKLLRLEDIPRIIFSEIMRNVDLFIGVASVGNDPNWMAGGEQGGFGNYWYDYSFGDLSATAKTRKEVLERLIPRLKISKQCTFEDKCLVVKGELRTYKIHLGSGNILMSPNDQYLCIVAARSSESTRAGKVFLPFEGDITLALILSKALMLAEDTKITDPQITRQIKN